MLTRCRADGTDDGHLRVATECWLQDACELAVTVRYVRGAPSNLHEHALGVSLHTAALNDGVCGNRSGMSVCWIQCQAWRDAGHATSRHFSIAQMTMVEGPVCPVCFVNRHTVCMVR